MRYKTRVLGAYALTVMLVAMLFVPLYITTLDLQRQSTIANMDRTIQNATTALERELTNLHHIASLVLTNSNFATLMNKAQPLEVEDYYKLRQAREYLSTMVRTFQYVGTISVMFKNDIVITSERVFTSLSDYYDTFMYVSPLLREQWLEATLARPGGMQPESPMFLYEEGEKERLSYLISLPYGTSSFKSGFLMGILTKSDLLARFGLSARDEGFLLYLEDAYGTILMRQGYQEEGVPQADLDWGEGVHQGQKTVWRQYPLMNGSLCFVLGIEESVFVQSLASIRGLLLTYAVVAIVIALALALTISYRQNKPMRTLLSTIHTAGIADPGKRRDFEYIQYAIGELVRTRGRLEGLADKQRGHVAAGLFDRLLKDGLDSEELEEAQAYLDDVPERYRLVYMKMTERSNGRTASARLLAADLLGGMFVGSAYVHTTGPSGIVLVVQSEESAVFPLETLEHIREYFFMQYGARTYAGVSREYKGLANLHSAFKEARAALDQCDEAKNLILFEAINPAEHQIHMWHKANDKLYQVLLSGEADVAQAQLERVLELYAAGGHMNSQGLRQLFYSLRGIGVAVCSELGLVQSHSGMPEFDEEMTLGTLEMGMRAYIARICEEIGSRKSSHNSRLKEEMIRYIADRFADSMLNAEMIGDQFNISTKYVFNFVKEQTGVTLSELIENYRMDEAVRLLRETDMQLALVAERVGYASANTFYKTFKRRFGMAPGQWRQTQEGPPSGP